MEIAETDVNGNMFHRTTIAEQVRSQVIALERAARDARHIEHLATF